MSNFSITSGLIRGFRRYHKWIGLFLAIFLLISALSGMLLGWKKNIDILQPTEIRHGAVNVEDYLGFAEMSKLGNQYWQDAYPEVENQVKRIDVKMDKGIVKLLYTNGYWEAQIHPIDGSLLSLKRRHSDWIEALHDGSLVSDNFKLIMMTLLGLGLTALSVTGFYLWYGPVKIRERKKDRKA